MAIVHLSQSTNKLYRDFFLDFPSDRGEDAAAKTEKWMSDGLETTDNIPIATLGPGGAELSWAAVITSKKNYPLSMFVCDYN